ncbi:GNAT family protein [Bdellovibrio sp. 22V]|uniref:GNAT family N-acetyltransferase n=1 Tax=Bdellovibrio TaxID=958 RepID=UPI002543130D|nr:GNAT family protein [Bdellovibrio sp. 22V]WII70815.1 GNAT family protein [Bdellovibrio sp. 22V]
MKALWLPESLTGERVTLRKHNLELAETMFQYIDQDRKRLVHLPWVDFTHGVHDERDYIEMTHREWEDFKMFDYGLFRNEGDVYMGNIGVHTIAWDHDRCELGYWILGNFEGHGYVSEGVRLLEKTLFDVGFHRIEIHCSGANTRSGAVAERCGYKLEGVLREHAVEQGARRDTRVYAKLKHER